MAGWFHVLKRDLSTSRIESFGDRLIGTYTVIVMLMLAVYIFWSTVNTEGNITCHCPAQFTQSHVDYANKICWLHNSNYVVTEMSVPEPNDVMGRPTFSHLPTKLSPLLMVIFAFILLLPRLLWSRCSRKLNASLGSLLDLAAGYESHRSDDTNRQQKIRNISNAITSFLNESPACACISMIYVFIKLFYFVVCIVLVLLMQSLLKLNLNLYLPLMLHSLYTGSEVPSSSTFPVVFWCNYQIRHQARVHDYVVQCTLSGNQTYERIWVFLAFWLQIVTAISFMGLLKYIVMLLCSISGVIVRCVAHRLLTKNKIIGLTDPRVKVFAGNFLKLDGYFVIRLISVNIGEECAAEVCGGLWDIWERKIAVEESLGDQQMTVRLYEPEYTKHEKQHSV